MSFKTGFLFILGLILVSGSSFGETVEKKFPYLAEVIGKNVNVRSGYGTAYYSCGKISAPGKVIVAGKRSTWLKVIPPKGSFSWISANYVKRDAVDPSVGMLTGDNVKVYAGAVNIEPRVSAMPQTKLSKINGDMVNILEERDGYYKIVPPLGAYLWIKGAMLKYVGPVPTIKPFESKKLVTPKPVVKPGPVIEPGVITPPVVEPVVKVTPKVKVVVEHKFVVACREISKKIDAEAAKPLGTQNYTAIKKELEKITKQKESEKAKIFASYLLVSVDRYVLAASVDKELKSHRSALAQARKKIEEQRTKKTALIKDEGKYIVEGVIKESAVYKDLTTKRYLIVNDLGKIICYAVADSGAYPDNLMNKKVALTGKLVENPFNAASLVMFTGITEVK